MNTVSLGPATNSSDRSFHVAREFCLAKTNSVVQKSNLWSDILLQYSIANRLSQNLANDVSMHIC